MHVLWKKRTHATNRQMGEPICPHTRIRHPTTLTPVMNLYDPETRKYRTVWRIAPGIRECCLNNPLARAAWWWEVNQRFEDLIQEGLEDTALKEALLESRTFIEELLERVVQKPSYKERREYLKLSQGRRRVKAKIPTFVEILGVNWPCSRNDLKAAWKRLALRHHPDRGGSSQDFIRIKNAYDAAIQRVTE